MTKRIGYIHVGPHQTRTTSIQWFLQENSAESLTHCYFVPESETKRGARHALTESLSGLDVGRHREPLASRSIAAMLRRLRNPSSLPKLWRDSFETDSTQNVFSIELQN